MRTSMPFPEDPKRLRALFESAANHATEANRRANQASIHIAKGKTQYFEKIALASAGTIALVVSFIGSHAGCGWRIHPFFMYVIN